MKYQVLATDYDGTLATNGKVLPATIIALRKFKNRGGKLILVTGRKVDELLVFFPQVVPLFDRVVAENGAIHFITPSAQQLIPPAVAASSVLVRILREKGVEPLSVGQSIIATSARSQKLLKDTIQELELPYHLILNKNSLMALPKGVDKGVGLTFVLKRLELRLTDVIGIGDAQNDSAFLKLCGCSVAVANALPELKLHSDRVTLRPEGEGVIEAIEWACSAS